MSFFDQIATERSSRYNSGAKHPPHRSKRLWAKLLSDKWLRRNVCAFLIAIASSVGAVILTTQLQGGVDARVVVPHLFFGVFAERNVITSDPTISYSELHGQQFAEVDVPAPTRDAVVSIVIPDVRICKDGGISPVNGLGGTAIETRVPSSAFSSWSSYRIVDLPVAHNRQTRIACQISNPAWRKSPVDRWLSFGLIDGAQPFLLEGFGKKVALREVRFHIDTFFSPFSTIEVDGGNELPSIGKYPQMSPYDSHYTKYLSTLPNRWRFADVRWVDDDAVGLQNLKVLAIGVLASVSVAAAFDLVMRLLEGRPQQRPPKPLRLRTSAP